MINGNKVHYIASGLNHLRLNVVHKYPSAIEWTKQAIKKMHTDDYEVGFLYNAYTEKHLGSNIAEMFSDTLCDLHADSGGLQMITRGHVPTEKMKTDVYENQAKHSTIAMSFDEIPVTSSGVTDFANRVFQDSLVEEKAIESGNNLVDQLKLFAERKTKSKPLLIAQGNDMDTYCRWVDIVQKQIPSELLPMLGGIALAGASMGNGDLENARTAFYYTQMDLKFDCKQVHLLGVGSFTRFLPTLVLMKSGLYKDLVISLDSTSHTGNVTRNTYTKPDQRIVKLGRYYDPIEYDRLFEHFKFFDPGLRDGEDTWHNLAGGPIYCELRDAGADEETMCKYLQAKIALGFTSAKHLLDAFVDYTNGRRVHKLVPADLHTPMRALGQVKDKADFLHWERNFAAHMQSNPVKKASTNTLDNFF